ncbi:hypothetical protein ACFQ0T_40490 [Kitasatospora gansuensis]
MTSAGEPSRHENAGPLLYRWLRENDSRSHTEAAQALGLDAREAAVAWAELRALRLVRPGSAIGETDLVEPDTALLGLLGTLRQKRAVLSSHCQELTSIVSATESLLERYRPAAARLTERIEVEVVTGLRNQQRVLRDFAELPRTQSRTLHADTVPSKTMSQTLSSFLTEKGRMVRRGVTVRAIYPQGFNSARWQCKYLAEVRRVGVELRLAPQVPCSLVIGDLDVALLPPRPGRLEDPLVVIRGAALVRTYAALYDDHWLRAFPYPGPAEVAAARRATG